MVVQTKAYEKTRIFEAGCGRGLGALQFHTTLSKPGSIMVCSDLSDEMLDSFGKRI